MSPDTAVQYGQCVAIQILSAIWETGKMEPTGVAMASWKAQQQNDKN